MSNENNLTNGVIYEKEGFSDDEIKEFREGLLGYISGMIDYCEHEERKETSKDKLELLAFCILSALDGCAGDIGGFMLIPVPESHFEDPEYKLPGNLSNFDIGGELHSELIKYRK